MTPNFNVNSGAGPLCSGSVVTNCDYASDAAPGLVPLRPRDTGPGGFYETFTLAGGLRSIVDHETLDYTALDRFFEEHDDWLPAGLVAFTERDWVLITDAVISVAAFSRGDGSVIAGRSGSTTMDVLVRIDSSTFAPYVSVSGKDQDPTSGGNVLGPFVGDSTFSGAVLYPVGSANGWIPASTPTISSTPWILFTPLRTELL